MPKIRRTLISLHSDKKINFWRARKQSRYDLNAKITRLGFGLAHSKTRGSKTFDPTDTKQYEKLTMVRLLLSSTIFVFTVCFFFCVSINCVGSSANFERVWTVLSVRNRICNESLRLHMRGLDALKRLPSRIFTSRIRYATWKIHF